MHQCWDYQRLCWTLLCICKPLSCLIHQVLCISKRLLFYPCQTQTWTTLTLCIVQCTAVVYCVCTLKCRHCGGVSGRLYVELCALNCLQSRAIQAISCSYSTLHCTCTVQLGVLYGNLQWFIILALSSVRMCPLYQDCGYLLCAV